MSMCYRNFVLHWICLCSDHVAIILELDFPPPNLCLGDEVK